MEKERYSCLSRYTISLVSSMIEKCHIQSIANGIGFQLLGLKSSNGDFLSEVRLYSENAVRSVFLNSDYKKAYKIIGSGNKLKNKEELQATNVLRGFYVSEMLLSYFFNTDVIDKNLFFQLHSGKPWSNVIFEFRRKDSWKLERVALMPSCEHKILKKLKNTEKFEFIRVDLTLPEFFDGLVEREDKDFVSLAFAVFSIARNHLPTKKVNEIYKSAALSYYLLGVAKASLGRVGRKLILTPEREDNFNKLAAELASSIGVPASSASATLVNDCYFDREHFAEQASLFARKNSLLLDFVLKNEQ